MDTDLNNRANLGLEYALLSRSQKVEQILLIENKFHKMHFQSHEKERNKIEREYISDARVTRGLGPDEYIKFGCAADAHVLFVKILQ